MASRGVVAAAVSRWMLQDEVARAAAAAVVGGGFVLFRSGRC